MTRKAKLTVEKLGAGADNIDVHTLHHRGMLTDRWISFVPILGWPRIAKIRAARHLVVLDLRDRTDPQHIRVSWTPLNFGGMRPWLHCPCGRRVVKLFNGLAGYYCRQCFDNPRYAGQSKSTQGRRHFEACKLRLRLGGIASLTAPFPERPRGMHQKTYERLRRRADELEARISPRLREKPTDYPSLIYYLPPQTSK